MPRQIVINRRYGGFSLSEEAVAMYHKLNGSDKNIFSRDIPRDDPLLIQVIQTLGEQASSGSFAKLRIVQIPDDIPADGWTIQDYDGIEWVAEKHRVWTGEGDDEDEDKKEPAIEQA
jgi:hypothetical protein